MGKDCKGIVFCSCPGKDIDACEGYGVFDDCQNDFDQEKYPIDVDNLFGNDGPQMFDDDYVEISANEINHPSEINVLITTITQADHFCVLNTGIEQASFAEETCTGEWNIRKITQR